MTKAATAILEYVTVRIHLEWSAGVLYTHTFAHIRTHRLMTLIRMQQSQKHALSDYYSHVNHRCQHNGNLERNVHDERVKHKKPAKD